MRYWLGLCAVWVSLTIAPPAAAHSLAMPVTQQPQAIVDASITLAGEFWDREGIPALPSCPRPRVVFADIAPDRAGEAPVAGCELRVQRTLIYDGQNLCVLVTHEMWHQRGHEEHDPDPSSVAAASSWHSTPECDRLGRWMRALS